MNGMRERARQAVRHIKVCWCCCSTSLTCWAVMVARSAQTQDRPYKRQGLQASSKHPLMALLCWALISLAAQVSVEDA